MIILKPKICLVYHTSHGYWSTIRNTLISNGFQVTLISENTTPTPTIEMLRGHDIVMYIQYSTPATIWSNVFKQAFSEGINIIEIPNAGSGFTLAVVLGIVNSATSSTATPNLITDDTFGIGKRSGLLFNTEYNFNPASTSSYQYIITGSNSKAIYTNNTVNKNVKGIIQLKGLPSILEPNGTNAHFASYGDMFYVGSSLTPTNEFYQHLFTVFDFMMERYKIKGTVKTTAGVPLIRDIFVYERQDGSFVTKTKSLSDGSFEVRLPVNKELYVVAKSEDSDTKATVIYDRVIPTVISYS